MLLVALPINKGDMVKCFRRITELGDDVASCVYGYRASRCEEIINCRGDQVRLGLRVRVFPYPEAACATWLMFACKYKSVL